MQESAVNEMSSETTGSHRHLLREVNERIRQLGWKGPPARATRDFVCECAADDCRRSLSLTRKEYERIRAQPSRFALLPGHECESSDRIVERQQHYVAVESLA